MAVADLAGVKLHYVERGAGDPPFVFIHGIQFGVTVGAGHFNQLEVPEQVNPMIDRFVRGLA